MSYPSSRRFPVTVTHPPVTRCQICRRTVAYRPGNLGEVLTGHCRRAHPEAPGLPSRSRPRRPQRCPADTATGLPLETNSPQSLAGGRQRSPNVIGAGARPSNNRYARLFEDDVHRWCRARTGFRVRRRVRSCEHDAGKRSARRATLRECRGYRDVGVAGQPVAEFAVLAVAPAVHPTRCDDGAEVTVPEAPPDSDHAGQAP